MIRVTVLYPSTATRFDYDYYLGTHTPMLQELWGPLGLMSIQLSRGVSGLIPGSTPTYVTLAVLTFSNAEALQACVSSSGAQILGDIPNFTDVQPDVQINEVLM